MTSLVTPFQDRIRDGISRVDYITDVSVLSFTCRVVRRIMWQREHFLDVAELLFRINAVGLSRYTDVACQILPIRFFKT